MKTYSNKIDPPKNGKKPASEPLSFSRGTEKKTYTPARTMTGDTRYGKESAGNKDAKFIEDARAKKQDIAYKDGKPYRAGTTTSTKTPDKVNVKIDVNPEIKPVKMAQAKESVAKKEVKPSGKSAGKLKAMAMTYGTDSPSGGGTRYKSKVRSLRGG